MADKICCVPGCGKSRLDNVILHTFPKPDTDADRFRTWMYAIGGEILSLDSLKIFNYRKVCGNHFELKFHTRSKRLSANAIPTLHLPGFSVTRGPMQDITNVSCCKEATQPVASTSAISCAKEKIQAMMSTSAAEMPLHTEMEIDADKVNTIAEKEIPTIQKPETSEDSKLMKTKAFERYSSDMKILSRKLKRLQATKDKYSVRLKKALNLSENATFQNTLKKFSKFALIFTLLQFREIGKKKMGHRFTKNEKVMALALYKQGPKAYRWLRQIFVLPSPLTLSRLLARAALKPGINENLFQHLKNRVKKMNDLDKLCILIFDEIALAPHFDYNKRRDEVVGSVSNRRKIADHALVFMIRGIVKNFKQPIAYTFCAGSTEKNELVSQITEIIKKLHETGMLVLATVCDQGASNKSAIAYLIKETKAKYLRKNKEWKKNTFEIDSKEIVPLFDAPHLMKGIRNNLLDKNLMYTKNGETIIAKWEHVEKLYKENPAFMGIRMLPKLTDQHVFPNKIKKMKVKCATQVFSRSVAVAMGYLADKGILPQEATGTAETLLFFDKLFDSVNGSFENSKKRSGKELLRAVTPKSCHHKVWNDCKEVLKSMKFINKDGKSCIVPSLKNWIESLTNLEYLSDKIFKKYKCKSLWLRHFNQDPLENFFGCVRSHGARNTNPTCAGFEIAFAALLVNNLNSLHSTGANCEKDSCESLKTLGQLFFNKLEKVETRIELNETHLFIENVFIDYDIKMGDPKVKAQIEYVSGFLVKKMFKLFKSCQECHNSFFSKNEETLDYIKRKDYKKYLTYPSDEAMKCFSQQQDLIIYIIRENIFKKQIKSYLMTLLSLHCNYDFIKCVTHKSLLIEKMQDLLSRFFVCNWCRDTNRIIKGIRQDFDAADEIQEIAYSYYKKRNKK